eukprot:scaffold358_cov256-Pinguiococcus_pyrenoidosus.AAC.11
MSPGTSFTANSLFHLIPTYRASGHLRCEAQVADLNVHRSVQKDVPKLQVAMNDADAMHVLDPIHQLQHDELDLPLRQTLPPLYEVGERP